MSEETVPLEILTKREREGIRKAVRNRYRDERPGGHGGHGNWAKPVIEKLLNTCDELESQLNSCRAEHGELPLCPDCDNTMPCAVHSGVNP